MIVDGSPTPSTRLTLSHWPGSPTPVELLDDLSAQIAFRALERPALFEGIEAVSNNHFDQDGLASAYALVCPDEALARRSKVIDVASAGDFATFRDRDAMRVAIAIAAMEDPDRSPLDAGVFAGDYPQQCGRLYEEILPRFGELLDDVSSARALWIDEDAHLQASLDAIASGVIRIDEYPEIDLAVVTVPDDWAENAVTRFTSGRSEAVHPAAVNQSTERFRVAVVKGHQYRVEMRYESWVMYRSRTVLARPDLRPLVPQLQAEEAHGAMWRADAPGALTPTMRVDGDSDLAPPAFVSLLRRFLAAAPAAWDPYPPTTARPRHPSTEGSPV